MLRIEDHTQMFEALQQFCSIVGEGMLEPHKEVNYYYWLQHPTHPDNKLLVHMNYAFQRFSIYIRSPIEGASYKSFDDMPLVHDIQLSRQFGLRPIFPKLVDIHERAVTYHYEKEDGNEDLVEMPHEVYSRFKDLFSDENPPPWTESKLKVVFIDHT